MFSYKPPSKSTLVKGIVLTAVGIIFTAFIVGLVVAVFGIYYLVKYFRQREQYKRMMKNLPPPLKKPWWKRK